MTSKYKWTKIDWVKPDTVGFPVDTRRKYNHTHAYIGDGRIDMIDVGTNRKNCIYCD